MNESQRAVIIGGGISGFSAAFFLSQRASFEQIPLRITLLEASDRFGGVLRSLSQGPFRMEAGADAFYAGQNDALDLCHELDLQKELVPAAPCFRRFFYLKRKKIFSLPGFPRSLGDLLRYWGSPQLTFPAKCRMLAEPFIARLKEDMDESLANFVRRRLGTGFYREVVAPLIQGVYMMDPERVSMQALFPTLSRVEERCGSLTGAFFKGASGQKKGSEFLTLKDGFEGLFQTFERRLGGYTLKKLAPVRRCVRDGCWKILMEDGSLLEAEILGLAMNACDASRLFSATIPEISRALLAVHYDSIMAINVAYKVEDIPKDMAPGFWVPADGGKYPFSSLKWLGRGEDGKYVRMRAFLSANMMSGVFYKDPEELKRELILFLSGRLGIRTAPFFMEVVRYPEALPNYEVGHLEKVEAIEEVLFRYPGLFVTGNGFRGFGITDCIRQARIAVSNLPDLSS